MALTTEEDTKRGEASICPLPLFAKPSRKQHGERRQGREQSDGMRQTHAVANATSAHPPCQCSNAPSNGGMLPGYSAVVRVGATHARNTRAP